MLRSLYAGVSGLTVNQQSMDVIGNNIANVNTIGFKEGRAVFQDLMSQTLTGGKSPSDARGGIDPMQVGSGAYLASVDNIFEQGVIATSSSSNDLAISGNGMFILRGEGDEEIYYSRAGAFNFDQFGTLTNPSGYKVQGWMSDPISGELNVDTGATDIILGTEYQVMQPKASTEINIAGNLDSRAEPSILQYPKFLTQAAAQQTFSEMTDANGIPLDLADGEAVKIRAHATETTAFANLFDDNDVPLGIAEGDTITFSFENNVTVVLKYSSTTDHAATGIFNTTQGFIDAVNAQFAAEGVGATMEMEEGRFVLQGNAGGVGSNFTLSGISGNSMVANALNPLTGAYTSSYSKTSNEVFYVTEVANGEDFNNLTELGTQVERAINGHVLGAAGLTVNYLENNFGLRNGEGVTLTANFGGGDVTIPPVATFPNGFTYTDNVNADPTIGEFNTVAQLASLIEESVNANSGSGTDVLRIGTYGNEMLFDYIGTAGTFSITGVTSNAIPVAGAADPNQYLEDLLTASFNDSTGAPIVMDVTNSNLAVQDIAGKGRLVYTNNTVTDPVAGTVGKTLTGFSIEKASNGEIFNDNILTSSVIGESSTSTSELFLADADENSRMLDLFTPQGETFHFTEGVSSLNFNASVGGEKVTSNNIFSIDSDSTVLDLMTSMEFYLGLGAGYNTLENVTMKDGQISVRGEEGQTNALDYFSVESALSESGNFTTQMTPEIIQEASGGYLPTNIELYDEQGNRHVVNVQFSLHNTEKNEWKVSLGTDDPLNSVSINGATTNELVIKFNSDGSMAYVYDNQTDPSTIIVDPTIRFSAANGTNTIDNIELNLGSPASRDGLTLAAAASGFTQNSTDGYPQGNLEQYLFNPAGELIGSYSNGVTRVIAQVGLATFPNEQGLMKVGDSMFAETGNSGDATVGTPQSASRGDIMAGSLENSNVDLSRELVTMITTQRGFEANSKIITTSDEMIQEILSMKR